MTDPPYGSYVHYADLTNFWSVWLPAGLSPGLGEVMDASEEAVIARKPHFAGAKSVTDYRLVLERVFAECWRVLKPGRYLVLTFNNREPRAWIALLAAAVAAGFELPPGGVIFQGGIRHYAHTAQARRRGSVHGDFVYSFVRGARPVGFVAEPPELPSAAQIEARLLEECRGLLANGPLSPNAPYGALPEKSGVLRSTCPRSRAEPSP